MIHQSYVDAGKLEEEESKPENTVEENSEEGEDE